MKNHSLNRNNLRSWQRQAIARAAKGPLLIAAAPGAGKAITKLTAIADGLAAGSFRRVLFVAPRLIIDAVIEPEARRWEQTSHLTFAMAHRYMGADRDRAIFSTPSDIVTATPDLLVDVLKRLNEAGTIPFDAIFVDEAQAFKNPGSVRTKALHALAEVVPHVVLASGTPTPNGVIDAWSPARAVARGNRFWDAEFHRWRARHFDKRGTYGWSPRKGAEQAIRAELQKCALAIRLQDAADIPREIYLTHPFEHPPAHKAVIGQFMEERAVEVAGQPFAASGYDDGGFLIRLHELTNGFAYLAPDWPEVMSMARVEALREIAESVEGPVLVGIKFRADAMMIKKVFPKAELYTGDTSTAERSDIIQRWNSDKIPMLLGNPASIGVGLNLQQGSAQTLVWYSAPFSWEQYAQMNARLVRSGQPKIVSIVTLQSETGIDRAIASVLQRKGAGEKALMDALDISKRNPGS